MAPARPGWTTTGAGRASPPAGVGAPQPMGYNLDLPREGGHRAGIESARHGACQRLLGRDVPPVIEPERGDRRFRDPAWGDNAVFDFIKQSYLLTSRWLVETVNRLDGADEKTRQKIDFYTRQFVDAMAPSNFVATNPDRKS